MELYMSVLYKCSKNKAVQPIQCVYNYIYSTSFKHQTILKDMF